MVLRGQMIASMKARLDNREYFLKTHFFGKSLTVINKRKQLFQRRLYVLAILFPFVDKWRNK